MGGGYGWRIWGEDMGGGYGGVFMIILFKYFSLSRSSSSYLFESFLFALIQFLVLELPLTQLGLQLLNVLTEC